MRSARITALLTLIVVSLLGFPEDGEAAKRSAPQKAKMGTPVSKRPAARRPPEKVAPPEMSESRSFRSGPPLSATQEKQVAAHRDCMNVLTAEGLDAALLHVRNYQMGTNLLGRDKPEKHGQETCIVRALGLTRFLDAAEIRKAQGRYLVSLAEVDLRFKENIMPDERYARPWVRDYLAELARDMRSDLAGDKGLENYRLLLGSVLRTYRDQQGLVMRNMTPADCRYDELCSSHTTGVAVDISLRDMPIATKEWLARRLERDRDSGRILAILEKVNNCFHLIVIPPENVPG